jgi:DMSO/TMAO reductase YedYZ molybdopterin-dependent catalytic subunit
MYINELSSPFPWEGSAPEGGRAMSRRLVLGRTAGGILALGGSLAAYVSPGRGRAEASEAELIVRNSRPADLETPVTALDGRITPNRMFFVRSHLSTPAVGLGPWGLQVGGSVDHPRELSLDDLKGLEQVTVPGVLQCAGNGRAFFRPRLPGVQWERGAVGHAEWTGVRLSDLLAKAGLKRGVAHVHLLGADAPPSPKTPAYLRSIPIERALDPSTIVATAMNGEPLPFLHGGPIRLVVPGWTGNHWLKWLREITVSHEEAPGTYQQTSYRIPKAPAPPGAALKPSDLVPLTFMNVKSLITYPAEGAVLRPGRHEVRGVAWTGPGHVTSVEVATGSRGAWSAADVKGDERQGSWRTWIARWEASRPGTYTLRARATDSQGQTQPEVTPWNRSGYLWNGIDQVTCEVR